eukprot:scaffold72067_cov63-Phaeocystis_antarctica.AAC.6
MSSMSKSPKSARASDSTEATFFHDGSKLHVEHVREGKHGYAEDDAEEGQVGLALAQHCGHQAHLGDEHVGELDDLEQLDAHAGREVDLGGARRGHHSPVIVVAHLTSDGEW